MKLLQPRLIQLLRLLVLERLLLGSDFEQLNPLLALFALDQQFAELLLELPIALFHVGKLFRLPHRTP